MLNVILKKDLITMIAKDFLFAIAKVFIQTKTSLSFIVNRLATKISQYNDEPIIQKHPDTTHSAFQKKQLTLFLELVASKNSLRRIYLLFTTNYSLLLTIYYLPFTFDYLLEVSLLSCDAG